MISGSFSQKKASEGDLYGESRLSD